MMIRGRWQFGLASLFWLTALAAMGLWLPPIFYLAAVYLLVVVASWSLAVLAIAWMLSFTVRRVAAFIERIAALPTRGTEDESFE